jgi:formamidopyrimidine-DNA glycosylase
MPELPEVETTLRGIESYANGAIIESFIVRQRQLRWQVPVDQLVALQGQKIHGCSRRAKYLILTTEKGGIIIHLGMSGSLRVIEPKSLEHDEPGKHDHVDIKFKSGYAIRLNDPRKFGSVLFTDQPIDEHKLIKLLGPEPLSDEFNPDYLFKQSRKRNVAVKNFIMNGHVVVGVGNIYASESLFLAGIRPSKKAGRLSKKQCVALVGSIKQVLEKAIHAGGTTLNDFLQTDGKPGYFTQELQVYGRDSQACFVCDTPIKSTVIGQRNTFYCSACQK